MKSITVRGVAVLAVLSLTAVIGASSASASGFVGDKYPYTFNGAPTNQHELKINEGTILCTGAKFKGYVTAPTEAPGTYSNEGQSCKYWGSPTMKMNGCQFIFHPGAQSGATFGGSYEIGPAGCGPITITSGGCQISIGAQKGLAATYENVGSGSTASVNVKSQATGLVYTMSAGCGAGTYSNGEYRGTWNLTAEDAANSQIGTKVVSELPTGFFLAGEKSEDKAKQPRFEAERYPAKVTGTQTAAKPFQVTTKSGLVKCIVGKFPGQIAAATTELSVGAELSSCTGFGLAASVNMKSCTLGFQVLNVTPYGGTLNVSCTKVGDAIEIKTGGGVCVVTIPPQSGLGGLSYENLGSGFGRTVAAAASVSTLKYTETGALCSAPGTYENGALSVGATFAGSY